MMHHFLVTLAALITGIICLCPNYRAHIQIQRDFSYTHLRGTYIKSLPDGWDILAETMNGYDLQLTMPDGREIAFESYIDEDNYEVFHITVDEQLAYICNYKGTKTRQHDYRWSCLTTWTEIRRNTRLHLRLGAMLV